MRTSRKAGVSDVKNKNLPMALCAMLATVALAATLASCAPAQPSGEAAGGDAASYPTGSLMAAHPAGQLDGMDEYPNKLCLSCHDRDTINAANDDFGGIEGFNPHKAHLEAGDCTSCHSVDGTSTLSCNECHDAPLPEGWQSAERGSGPLHSLTK